MNDYQQVQNSAEAVSSSEISNLLEEVEKLSETLLSQWIMLEEKLFWP